MTTATSPNDVPHARDVGSSAGPSRGQRPSRAAVRLIGALTAAAVSGLITLGAHALGWTGTSETGVELTEGIWISSVPVATVLAVWLSPRIDPASSFPWSLVAGYALAAVLLGAPVVGLVTFLADVVADPRGIDWASDLAGAFVFSFFGLVFFGLPMLALTFLGAFVWTITVRALLRRYFR